MNADRQALSKRWDSLCSRAGLEGDIPEGGRWLIDAYAAAQRAYHNLQHLAHCLTELDSTQGAPQDPIAAEFALWFHDSILDTARNDNEERSADWAASVLGFLKAPDDLISRVRPLILATRHVDSPDASDAQLVADIDLAILGQPIERYETYRAGIRQEYRQVPDEGFRIARLNFISRLLDKPRIYSTLTFRARYETAARENLQREMRALNG